MTTESRDECLGVEVAVIVPTYNERENVPQLLSLLDKALAGIRWEVIFVDDDSPDHTADVVRSLAQVDARVRCVQRLGRRGLASACVEGILASATPFVAVMDADMQHDESILPIMLAKLKRDNLDIVVGSRYVEGGDIGEWQGRRAAISRFATKLSRIISRADLRDPMSGYFLIRRAAFMRCAHRLSSIGFK